MSLHLSSDCSLMKHPYFSILGAVICGMLTVFFVLMFFFARGPGDALVPLFATIWTVVFGIPFLLFMARIVSFPVKTTVQK